MVPALFRRIRPRSDLATTCWKVHCWLLRLSTKRMIHVSRQASTPVVPGARKSSRFCLECRCRVCANLQVVLLAAFSCPLSRYYPLLYHSPVLRLLCADEICSAQWTICVLCLHLLTLRKEGARKGRCAGGDHAHVQALLLLRCAGVPSAPPHDE